MFSIHSSVYSNQKSSLSCAINSGIVKSFYDKKLLDQFKISGLFLSNLAIYVD